MIQISEARLALARHLDAIATAAAYEALHYVPASREALAYCAAYTARTAECEARDPEVEDESVVLAVTYLLIKLEAAGLRELYKAGLKAATEARALRRAA